MNGYSEAVMMSSDEMNKPGKVAGEQFDAMKIAEEQIKKKK